VKNLDWFNKIIYYDVILVYYLFYVNYFLFIYSIMDNFNYNNETESILSNIKNSINYVIENHHKFILLVLVFVIIYFVDYITYINSILYAAPPIPGLPSLNTPPIPDIKKPKRKQSIRRRR